MALNEDFLACLSRFLVLRTTYTALGGQKSEQDDQLGSIMESTFVSPLKDVVAASQELGSAALDSVRTAASIGDPIGAAARLFLLPLDNILNIVSANIPRELLERLKNFLERDGFALSLTDTGNFVATMFMSALQGVSTINHQRKLLKQLKRHIKKIQDGVVDTPSITPPFHPFNEALNHLEASKRHYSSVRARILTRNEVDGARYDEGTSELRLAKDSLYTGNFGEMLAQRAVDDAGLGGLIGVTNEEGQVKFINKEGLKAINFLPRVDLTLNMLVVKQFRTQLSVYNAHLNNVDGFLRYVIENLYLIVDISRLLGSLMEFLILEIKDIEEILDGSVASSPVGRQLPVLGTVSQSPNGTIQAQAEAAIKLNISLSIAGFIKKVLDRVNKNDINDQPAIKAFRKKLEKLDPSQCNKVSEQLDRNLEGFSAAYSRRVRQDLPARAVVSMGDRAIRSITAQLEYLDCFEDILNTLGLDKIPADILDAMATVGSALSFIQGFDGGKQVSELYKNFNPLSVIVAQMNVELKCMRDSCENPTVQSLLGRLMIDFNSLDRLFKTNANLNKSFADQAKFQKKQREDRLANAIQQFIDAIQHLSC
jgi:hypothetical protein